LRKEEEEKKQKTI